MAPSAPQALESILLLCEKDPRRHVAQHRAQAAELASRVGGALALRWEIVELRLALLAPPDDDSIRERYGALVDRHRDDAALMALLRPLGDEIRAAEAAGTLPSSLVVRSPRRRGS
jgi:hypothetical protein